MRLPDAQRSRVVLVGVGRYDAEDLPDLPQVAANLTGLAETIADPRLCGVDPRHVTVLHDPAGPHQAGSAVMTAADEAADLLLVYLAGRVTLAASGEPQLMLSNAGARRHAGALSLRLVRHAVESSSAAHKVVLLDCLLHGSADQLDAVDGMLVERVAQIAGASVLLYRAADPAAYVTPGRAGTAFTRTLLDVLLTRSATPHLVDLRTAADRVDARLDVPVAAGRAAHRHHVRHADGLFLHEGGAPLPLFRTPVPGEQPTAADLRQVDELAATADLAEHDFGHPDSTAEHYRRLVLASQRAFGLDHPATARARRLLARWCGMAGSLAEAVAILDELHRFQLAALGPDDPQTIGSGRDLAYWSQR